MAVFFPLVDRVPEILEVEDSGNDHAVRVVVARSMDGRFLSVVTTLRVSPVGAGAELKFECVVDASDDSGESFRTMDRNIARRYLPPELIRLVMPIVGASYGVLLGSLRPERLIRITKARHATTRQLEKHLLMNDVLSKCGYVQTDQGTDVFGRSYWIHKRVE